MKILTKMFHAFLKNLSPSHIKKNFQIQLNFFSNFLIFKKFFKRPNILTLHLY